MKLSQKRTCTGCRALNTYSKTYVGTCELGKKIKSGRVSFGVTINYIPLEPCLKPITIKESIEAREVCHQ